MAGLFTWDASFTRAGEKLERLEDKVAFYEGLMRYAETGETPAGVTPYVAAMLELAKPQIVSVAPIVEQKSAISEVRRRAARERWRKARECKAATENPPARSGAPLQSMQTSALQRLHDCASDLHEEDRTTTQYTTTTQFKDKESSSSTESLRQQDSKRKSSSTESPEQRDSRCEQEAGEIMREAERVGVRLTAGEA